MVIKWMLPANGLERPCSRHTARAAQPTTLNLISVSGIRHLLVHLTGGRPGGLPGRSAISLRLAPASPLNVPSARLKAVRPTQGSSVSGEHLSGEFSVGEGFEEAEQVQVAGEGVHAILWPRGTLQGAKLQSDGTARFYRPAAESQIPTVRLELLVELVSRAPHYYWLDFEGERASAANWKMESSNGFLKLLFADSLNKTNKHKVQPARWAPFLYSSDDTCMQLTS